MGEFQDISFSLLLQGIKINDKISVVHRLYLPEVKYILYK